MRMDHKNENVNMFDLIAYRIKFIPHPKVRHLRAVDLCGCPYRRELPRARYTYTLAS